MPRYYEGYEKDDNSTGAVLLTFILGAAAGVAAGMLLAPESGQANRRKIADAANDLATKAGTQWGTLKDSATSTIDKVKRKGSKKQGDQINNS